MILIGFFQQPGNCNTEKLWERPTVTATYFPSKNNNLNGERPDGPFHSSLTWLTVLFALS